MYVMFLKGGVISANAIFLEFLCLVIGRGGGHGREAMGALDGWAGMMISGSVRLTFVFKIQTPKLGERNVWEFAGLYPAPFSL